MRDVLSSLLVTTAENPHFVVLSGDHGYALFDGLRSAAPGQFLNVGIAEQAMVGIAAGLARTGFLPCLYGLAAFVPVRVLEQIKLDLCFGNLPAIILGDGAGLVYSTLGVSHQSGEDIACLRALPHISIFSPADAHELRACWRDALAAGHVAYIRLGKADRPMVHAGAVDSTGPLFTYRATDSGGGLIVATGSMVSPCTEFARSVGVDCVSVPRIRPLPPELGDLVSARSAVVVVEEHCRTGGLWTSILEEVASGGHASLATIESIALEPEFTHTSGSYQQALGEHALSDDRLRERLGAWLAVSRATGNGRSVRS